MVEKFAIALSEKDRVEAAKEVSLKLKSIFPKSIKDIILFFTPHYKPLSLFETINFALKPAKILGIQAPLLTFQDKIIEKGIIACCINKKDATLEEIVIKRDNSQDIETSLRLNLQKFGGEKKFILSFCPHHFSPANYLRGTTLATGKAFNIIGSGFIRRYAAKNYQLINNSVDESLLNIFVKGIDLDFIKISGFFPVGMPFNITRVISDRNIIMEINNEPAINIYKKYFEEKFDILKKNHLFSLYPLGITQGEETRLINITDCLEDGSLVCTGEVKNNTRAHLMMIHPPSLLQSLEKILDPIKNNREGLIFMINSLTRKKVLKDYAQEEIRAINHILGNKHKIIGIYSDYALFPSKATREIHVESGNILMTLWK
jgi:hypothetical protein